jgi:hypothetical protein
MKCILDLSLKTLACILLACILWMQAKTYKASEKLSSVVKNSDNEACVNITQPIEVVGYSYFPRLPALHGEPVKVQIVSDW